MAGGIADERQLEEFGYKQELPRVLRLWTNWAIGFAFISPIVGLYTVVALGAATAGPAWVWSVPIVIAGQLLVALVYAQLAARWPIAGGIYQWSRRLIGPRYGWWAGWIYIWALILTLSTVAYGGGGFLGQLVGIDAPTTGQSILLALLMMLITTTVNVIGLQLLRYTVNIGIACEAVASVGIGIALILFFRQQPVSVLTDTGGVADGGSYLPAFVAAVAIAGWILLGFDACGSVAEETRDAARQVPKAIVMSIVCVGIVDLIAAFALVLGNPDIPAMVSGEQADPVSAAVVAGLGSWAKTPFLVVVVTSFIACGIAVQGATVRVVFSYSRDGMFPLAHVWRKVAALEPLAGLRDAARGRPRVARLRLRERPERPRRVRHRRVLRRLPRAGRRRALSARQGPVAGRERPVRPPRARRDRRQRRGRRLARLRDGQHRVAAQHGPAVVAELRLPDRDRGVRPPRPRVLPHAAPRPALRAGRRRRPGGRAGGRRGRRPGRPAAEREPAQT